MKDESMRNVPPKNILLGVHKRHLVQKPPNSGGLTNWMVIFDVSRGARAGTGITI